MIDFIICSVRYDCLTEFIIIIITIISSSCLFSASVQFSWWSGRLPLQRPPLFSIFFLLLSCSSVCFFFNPINVFQFFVLAPLSLSIFSVANFDLYLDLFFVIINIYLFMIEAANFFLVLICSYNHSLNIYCAIYISWYLNRESNYFSLHSVRLSLVSKLCTVFFFLSPRVCGYIIENDFQIPCFALLNFGPLIIGRI